MRNKEILLLCLMSIGLLAVKNNGIFYTITKASAGKDFCFGAASSNILALVMGMADLK